VAAAVAELYGADPDAFTERRKALVAAAKEAGDREAASAIGALRKPTRAAWLVNRLARAEPSAAARLAALAAELRAAEQAKDGPRLRELSAARGALIDGLVGQALAAGGAGVSEASASLRAEVTATLTAALADPDTAAGFAAGTLTKAAQWSGFGYGDFAPADDASADDASADDPGSPDDGRSPTVVGHAPVDIATRRSRRARTATDSGRVGPEPTRAPRRAGPVKHDRTDASPSAEAAAREQQRLAAEEQRRAQEAAERAARDREKYEDAERTVAQASNAAAEAATVEDRLEAEVRQLEERLTQAREELATARLRARRAEAAERRARQGMDRLARP
jgi:hypothetical protein